MRALFKDEDKIAHFAVDWLVLGVGLEELGVETGVEEETVGGCLLVGLDFVDL